MRFVSSICQTSKRHTKCEIKNNVFYLYFNRSKWMPKLKSQIVNAFYFVSIKGIIASVALKFSCQPFTFVIIEQQTHIPVAINTNVEILSRNSINIHFVQKPDCRVATSIWSQDFTFLENNLINYINNSSPGMKSPELLCR